MPQWSRIHLQYRKQRRHRFDPWEDPLEEGMATHSSILARKVPWREEPMGCSPWGHKESKTAEATEHARTHTHTHTHTQEVPSIPATTHSHSTQSPRRPHSHRPVSSSPPIPSPIICLQTAVQTQISKSPGHACFSSGPGLKIPALRLLSNRP